MRAESEFELVVVGGGFSGLVAGLEAQRRGISTLICEASASLGGASQYSRGTIWTMHEELLPRNPRGRRELQELIVRETPAGRDWLRLQGVEFFESVDVIYGSGERTDVLSTLRQLAGEFERAGGAIRRETRVIAADREGSSIELTASNGTRFSARDVALATGGFAASDEFCRRYGIPVDGVRLRAFSHARGDGLKISIAAGAGITHADMATFYGHAMVDTIPQAAPEAWFDISQIYGHFVKAISYRGEPIRPPTDEPEFFSDEQVNMVIGSHHDGRAIYLVSASDLSREARPGAITIADTIDRLRHRRTDVLVAAAPAELLAGLRALGVDTSGANLRHTVELLDFPVRAVPVRAGRTLSGGGVSVDARMRVLSAGSPVEPVWDGHLFCIGADVGGINSGYYVGGLSTALVTALSAVSAIAT